VAPRRSWPSTTLAEGGVGWLARTTILAGASRTWSPSAQSDHEGPAMRNDDIALWD
jgi:hypothetical protein